MHSQAAQDGVDIVSLSITPNRRPPGIATFFNPIDMALLSAVKAGIFVVQAAGNTGPSPKSISSFSPWIFTIGAAAHDRAYSNSIVLGNNDTLPGVGLACKLIFRNYCFVHHIYIYIYIYLQEIGKNFCFLGKKDNFRNSSYFENFDIMTYQLGLI